jgi:hypothetical protein
MALSYSPGSLNVLAVSRWWLTLIFAGWAWILVVLVLTFWKVWEIPSRLPEINEIATTHLFLFPVSLLLFLSLSWIRQRRDEKAGSPPIQSFPRWRATLLIWLLIILHPVSCGLYPAIFNLDSRTVQEIALAVGDMSVGMPRAEVQTRIIALNSRLPIPMGADLPEHDLRVRQVAQYLSTQDPTVRERLWPDILRATLVFIPMAPRGSPPDLDGMEQLFRRRLRGASDIGIDTIRIEYGSAWTVVRIVYTSNRQLTEVRGPCTIHLIIPAPPEMSFPYPCPR